MGEYDFITGTGHHRRENSKYPDSNFKNHDGSHIRTVFRVCCIQNGISYHEALDEVVSILIDGITI